jgi:hypothetical protein
MSIARLDLMASVAGTIGGVTWHHLYLVGADASGKLAYLRAGPELLPIEHLVGRQTEHGSALEEHEASAAGPYGVITFSSGSYERNGVDFDPMAANVTLANGAAAAQLWEKVVAAAKALEEEKIPYDPVGNGANWALMEALRRSGVQPKVPPKRWTPGVSLVTGLELPIATRRIGEAVLVA